VMRRKKIRMTRLKIFFFWSIIFNQNITSENKNVNSLWGAWADRQRRRPGDKPSLLRNFKTL
jgi:hypothetical protein